MRTKYQWKEQNKKKWITITSRSAMRRWERDLSMSSCCVFTFRINIYIFIRINAVRLWLQIEMLRLVRSAVCSMFLQTNNSMLGTHNWPFDAQIKCLWDLTFKAFLFFPYFCTTYHNLMPIFVDTHTQNGVYVLSFNAHVHSNHRDYHCNLGISYTENRLTMLRAG